MRKVLIIGIGAGNPDHMTVQAIEALNTAQVVFIPDKGAEKAELRQLRHEICQRFARQPQLRFVAFDVPERSASAGYREGVDAWHAETAALYSDLLRRELDENGIGAFLVWGDPSLYDSTLRIVDAILARGDLPLACDMIPGITSVQALAAAHRVALNRIGEPVHITTGRRLADRVADDPGSTVVMLDGEQAFARLDGAAFDIHWGAYLGMPGEILLSGRLADVRDEIARRRAEARRARGWIMDVYLLRRRRDA